MSLIGFHRILIGTAILFCAGYALWEFAAFLRSGETASLLIALVFAALAGLLTFYLRHLARFLGIPSETDENGSSLP
ncbi:MAG: hypothetical protein GEU90_20470 [Gemmatimonas sp.]|nr:hypothetical protein [Gemmatimonas sp.]